MATQEVEAPAPAPAKHYVAHPLCPLTAAEISTTAALIRSLWPAKTDLRFKVITLDEPAKKDFLPYLDAEHAGSGSPFIARKAFVAYYIRNTVSLQHVVVLC
jgi:primary-amine oxidase